MWEDTGGSRSGHTKCPPSLFAITFTFLPDHRQLLFILSLSSLMLPPTSSIQPDDTWQQISWDKGD